MKVTMAPTAYGTQDSQPLTMIEEKIAQTDRTRKTDTNIETVADTESPLTQRMPSVTVVLRQLLVKEILQQKMAMTYLPRRRCLQYWIIIFMGQKHML